ncbi:MAG TPA: AMP-binding protein [Terrimicrobiaceae bacterium]
MRSDQNLAGGRLLHELVANQATLSPGQIAVVSNGKSLTYARLVDRSHSIAKRLRAAGIGEGDLVGVFLDRSFDLIASFLGILQAGAAYVPLDTNYPADRIAFMAADCHMKQILCSASLRTRLPVAPCSMLILDEPEIDLPARFGLEREPTATTDLEDQLAYIMYTSGSTGVPKGTAIPHRGIARLVREPDYVRISHEDVFLQASPVSFDASTFEIWGALTNGAISDPLSRTELSPAKDDLSLW